MKNTQRRGFMKKLGTLAGAKAAAGFLPLFGNPSAGVAHAASVGTASVSSTLRKLTSGYYGMQPMKPAAHAARENHRGSLAQICFQVGQNANPGEHTCGHWIVRDCSALGFGIGLDLQSAQFGEVARYSALQCGIGERITPSTTAGGGNSNKHTDCRYEQCDLGILLEDAGPYHYGDDTWVGSRFRENGTCVAAISSQAKHVCATFLDGTSTDDATTDMPAERGGVPRALWYWKAGGRLTIRRWVQIGHRTGDHIVVDGPALVTVDGYQGAGSAAAYVVRTRHAAARVDWYGRVGVRGRIQGIARWPDGYAMAADVFSASSIDGYPSERIDSAFPNLARQRSMDLRLAEGPATVQGWSVHSRSYIGWVWPGATMGPYFLGFMVHNLESYAQTLAIDLGHGAHEIDLAARQVKRFAYYCAGAFQEPRTVLSGQGTVRLDGIEVLWGPPSSALQARIDEALHLGTRDR